MKLVDITVGRVLPDPPDPEAWTDEQRATVNAWLDKMAAQFFLRACDVPAMRRIWVDEHGEMQIELVDALAAEAGAHPPAASERAKSGSDRADPAPMQPHWTLAYCGN
jgi:hypothetical protein